MDDGREKKGNGRGREERREWKGEEKKRYGEGRLIRKVRRDVDDGREKRRK